MNKILLKVLLLTLASINIYALEVVYEPRDPYVKEISDSIAGLVATPLIKALNDTNIKYTLKNNPSKRHLKLIQSNKKEICAVGWFKNPKREEFAKFSKALYRDKPMGILTHVNSNIQDGIDINELINTDKISILIKDSYSYGSFIDEKLKLLKVKKSKASNVKMVSMISKKRADFMFISHEEASMITKNHKYKDNIKFVNVKGVPAGNKRYLICSKKVSDNIIENINKYLK